MLVRGEEPQPVFDQPAAELGAVVQEVVALEREAEVFLLGRVAAGQAVALGEDVEVAVELVRALAGDDVVDRAVHVAILRRRPQRDDLDLFDGVDAGQSRLLVEEVVVDVDAVELE